MILFYFFKPSIQYFVAQSYEAIGHSSERPCYLFPLSAEGLLLTFSPLKKILRTELLVFLSQQSFLEVVVLPHPDGPKKKNGELQI